MQDNHEVRDGEASYRQSRLRVADEVWVAMASLQRDHPEREDFTSAEILERARQMTLTGHLRPGVQVHIASHCVANRKPSPGKYRMLMETTRGRRRLYRPGDPYHPDREGSKTMPVRSDLPAELHYLLDWYEAEYAPRDHRVRKEDPILSLRGLGKELWSDEEADAYVARMRESWA